MTDVKIATCCYCGTRAALALRGRERHELACASCGAPLHAMKRLRSRPEQRPVRTHEQSAQSAPRRPKRRKPVSLKRRLLAKAFDAIDDIFD